MELLPIRLILTRVLQRTVSFNTEAGAKVTQLPSQHCTRMALAETQMKRFAYKAF